MSSDYDELSGWRSLLEERAPDTVAQSLPSHLYDIALAAAHTLSQIELTALLELGISLVIDGRLTDKELLNVEKQAAAFKQDAQRYAGHSVPDHVYKVMYSALKRRVVTWPRAAEVASGLLGERLKPDTFRKRLMKWANDNDLPPVEQRKRRS